MAFQKRNIQCYNIDDNGVLGSVWFQVLDVSADVYLDYFEMGREFPSPDGFVGCIERPMLRTPDSDGWCVFAAIKLRPLTVPEEVTTPAVGPEVMSVKPKSRGKKQKVTPVAEVAVPEVTITHSAVS